MSFPFLDQYGQYIMGLGAVLILIGLLTWLVQKISGFGKGRHQNRENVSLRLLSSLQLDPKRRLVVVEFNKRKHLLLLGASSELVVESEDLAALYPAVRQERPSSEGFYPKGSPDLTSQKAQAASSGHVSRPFSFQKETPPLQEPKTNPEKAPPLPKELRP